MITPKVNDVIQIIPDHLWGGCLAVVSEVKEWGVQAYVPVPMEGLAYTRLKHDEYELVGAHAVFIITQEEDNETN